MVSASVVTAIVGTSATALIGWSCIGAGPVALCIVGLCVARRLAGRRFLAGCGVVVVWLVHVGILGVLVSRVGAGETVAAKHLRDIAHVCEHLASESPTVTDMEGLTLAAVCAVRHDESKLLEL